MLLPPNGEDVLFVFDVLEPKPPKLVPLVVAGLLPNRPPLLVVPVPNADFAAPKGAGFWPPNAEPKDDKDVSFELIV